MIANIIRDMRKPMPSPSEVSGNFSPELLAAMNSFMTYSFTGNKSQVHENLNSFISATNVDELMIVSHVYDQEAKRRSYSLLMEA
jgi:hypothetical protein